MNGTIGIVCNILYITDEELSHFEMLPVCILVDFQAISVPKSQGMILVWAVEDIGPKEFSCGLTYVTLSHARTMDGPSFTALWFFRINNGRA